MSSPALPAQVPMTPHSFGPAATEVDQPTSRAKITAAARACSPLIDLLQDGIRGGSPSGTKACATFFSLIETAKANVLEPFSYIRHIFEKLHIVGRRILKH
jgi:hypothetical protein